MSFAASPIHCYKSKTQKKANMKHSIHQRAGSYGREIHHLYEILNLFLREARVVY